MDVQKKLDEIVAAVSSARSMPMSASCVVNRAELLAKLDEVRAALPDSLAQAEELIGGREQMVEQARQEAERIISEAHAQRGSLIAETEIARRSQAEADRILAEARQEAEEIRAEADDYVDSKLANFEVVLTKTLGSVGRGREKLLGTGPGLDEQGYEDEDAPERSHDPETLRRNADAYVDVKLGAFEAVLAKTLEAVGRGRAEAARQDRHRRPGRPRRRHHDRPALQRRRLPRRPCLPRRAGRPGGRRPEQQQPVMPEQPPQPPAQPYAQPEPVYGYDQQADPYGGYQQQYGGVQDPYAQAGGYAQPDPYAAYQGYDASQQAYDHSQAAQHAPQQQPQQGYALDETSLFDTSMITPEQLEAYQRERGL